MRKCFLLSVTLLLLIGCQPNVDEEQLMNDYYEVLTTTHELFGYHTYQGEYYYNERYQTKEDISQLLDGKVTERGLSFIIEEVYEKEGKRLVYNNKYEEYIDDSNLYDDGPINQSTYYETVRESLLNPGLQFINNDQLEINRDDKKVTISGTRLPVSFYDESKEWEREQYQMFGYPPVDYVNVSFTFVREQGHYLLDRYQVEAIEQGNQA